MSDGYGLAVSQRDKDILQASVTEQIIRSDFSSMPIARSGLLDKTGNAGNTITFTIRHELDFVPFVLVFYKSSFFPTFWQWAPGLGGLSPVTPTGDQTTIANTDIRVDKENLVLRFALLNGSNEVITVRYFIFNVPIAVSV